MQCMRSILLFDQAVETLLSEEQESGRVQAKGLNCEVSSLKAQLEVNIVSFLIIICSFIALFLLYISKGEGNCVGFKGWSSL